MKRIEGTRRSEIASVRRPAAFVLCRRYLAHQLLAKFVLIVRIVRLDKNMYSLTIIITFISTRYTHVSFACERRELLSMRIVVVDIIVNSRLS